MLFLDEIGEMLPAAQAKLLRAIQNQEYQRVGSVLTRKVNIRILAATNRDLSPSMAEKSLREIYSSGWRWCISSCHLWRTGRTTCRFSSNTSFKSLRAQTGKAVDGITRRAEAALLRYDRPRVIRELENALGYACMVADSTQLDVHDLPDYIRSAATRALVTTPLVWFEQMQSIHAQAVVARQSAGGRSPQGKPRHSLSLAGVQNRGLAWCGLSHVSIALEVNTTTPFCSGPITQPVGMRCPNRTQVLYRIQPAVTHRDSALLSGPLFSN
jgi:hypothetical protein